MSLDLDVVQKPKWQYQICAFCDEKVDYKSLSEELQDKIDRLEYRIEQMHLKDTCYNIIYEKQEWDNKKYNHKFIKMEKPDAMPFYTEICKMITLTFDPRKFPVLFDRNAQRDYIQHVIRDYVELYNNGPIYGCYELHETGVVHSHFIIPNISNHEIDYLKKQFTNKQDNDKAVHVCEKEIAKAIKYINKPETKDKNNWQNFYYCDIELILKKTLVKPIKNLFSPL